VWQFEEWNPIYKQFRWGDMSDGTSESIERSCCPAPIMLLGFTQEVRRRYDTTGMKQYREHWAEGAWKVVAIKNIRRILVGGRAPHLLDKDAALKVVWQFEEWNPIYNHFRWGDMSDEISQYIELSNCPAPIMLLGFTQGVRRRYDTTGMKQIREHLAEGAWKVVATKNIRRILVVVCPMRRNHTENASNQDHTEIDSIRNHTVLVGQVMNSRCLLLRWYRGWTLRHNNIPVRHGLISRGWKLTRVSALFFLRTISSSGNLSSSWRTCLWMTAAYLLILHRLGLGYVGRQRQLLPTLVRKLVSMVKCFFRIT
jgi:hypothetical protein